MEGKSDSTPTFLYAITPPPYFAFVLALLLFSLHGLSKPTWVGLHRCYHNWMLNIWHHPQGALDGRSAIGALLANPGHGEEDIFKFFPMTSTLVSWDWEEDDPVCLYQCWTCRWPVISTVRSTISIHLYHVLTHMLILRKSLPPYSSVTPTKQWVTRLKHTSVLRSRVLVTVSLHVRMCVLGKIEHDCFRGTVRSRGVFFTSMSGLAKTGW